MNINFKIPDIKIISEKKCTEFGIQQSSRFAVKHTEPFLKKVEEYVLLLGFNCPNVYSIFISLLVEGKVEVQFKNYVERLILKKRIKNININSAFEIFEKTKKLIEWRMNFCNNYPESTQRIIIQQNI